MSDQPEPIDMNPLSRVRPDASIAMNAVETMTTRPGAAIKIAECIAEWAEIENTLGLVLAIILDSESTATIAMYAAVENRAAQLRMLEAAAESKLPKDHADVVIAILFGVVWPVMRERDKLAHWCWGYSLQLPDDLLLFEPAQKAKEAVDRVILNAFNIDKDHVFVVTEGDLTRLLWEASRRKGSNGANYGDTLEGECARNVRSIPPATIQRA